MIYLWAETWVFEHDGGVAELLNQTIPALNSGIRNLSDLVTAEVIPVACQIVNIEAAKDLPSLSRTTHGEWDDCKSLQMGQFLKPNSMDRAYIDEVDESIANIAVVGEV